MKVPTILEGQEVIIKWARKAKSRYINLSGIVSFLVNPLNKYHADDEDYVNAWNAYHKYNSSNKDNILIAIMIDCYRKTNDFHENDIVTNGVHVGFAKHIDLHKRDFLLCPSLVNGNIIGKFKLDDFSKVK